MIEQALIQEAENLVRKRFEKDSSGHDWWHIQRVRQTAVLLAKEEGANVFLCELAALLHDIPDSKLVVDEATSLRDLRDWLFEKGLDETLVEETLAIIQAVSFKGGHNDQKATSLEAKIVQDADRLDALGAIGIARTMAYSGHKNRPIHDPTKQPREVLTLATYRNGEDTAIMHFYEKLLKLKESMHTQRARNLAQERHAFLETYLEQFYAEWAGER